MEIKLRHGPLLAPIIALVAWTFVMLAWLYATRVPAIRTARIGLDPGQTKEEFDARIPARARWKASLVLLESFRFRLNQKTLDSLALSCFLHANRFPLRSKTLSL
jgi:hypothetical protein